MKCRFCNIDAEDVEFMFESPDNPGMLICSMCITYAFVLMRRHDRERWRAFMEHLEELRWESDGGAHVQQ